MYFGGIFNLYIEIFRNLQPGATPSAVAQTHGHVGDAHYEEAMRCKEGDPNRTANLTAAMTHLSKCLHLHKQNLHDDHVAAADVLCRVGDVHLALGEVEPAVTCYVVSHSKLERKFFLTPNFLL